MKLYDLMRNSLDWFFCAFKRAICESELLRGSDAMSTESCKALDIVNVELLVFVVLVDMRQFNAAAWQIKLSYIIGCQIVVFRLQLFMALFVYNFIKFI